MTSEAVRQRLAAAGLELPAVPEAVGSYVPAVRTGNLVFTSGQIPVTDGAPLFIGRVGDEVGIEDAQRCAELCALRALAAAAAVVDLDSVVRVVKVVGYVASAPAFFAQPSVIDRASAAMETAFGESGRHAREAVGVVSLPLGVPVEVSVVLEVS